MNWTTGPRSSVTSKVIAQKQRDFFEKKRSQKRTAFGKSVENDGHSSGTHERQPETEPVTTPASMSFDLLNLLGPTNLNSDKHGMKNRKRNLRRSLSSDVKGSNVRLISPEADVPSLPDTAVAESSSRRSPSEVSSTELSSAAKSQDIESVELGDHSAPDRSQAESRSMSTECPKAQPSSPSSSIAAAASAGSVIMDTSAGSVIMDTVLPPDSVQAAVGSSTDLDGLDHNSTGSPNASASNSEDWNEFLGGDGCI
ncbi:hypothetical protein DFJ77DRAFT_474937 [Powellomyces hirtus]|nr:hypothetical protein DFJ77DRAFT_474937 [Powellomyces hirtus]